MLLKSCLFYSFYHAKAFLYEILFQVGCDFAFNFCVLISVYSLKNFKIFDLFNDIQK